ncbi:hypothetical protein [Methylocapsa aurea]|uniref:hypothetical protein n=1 Tax=Methylocapsa aurea TaxID=663610 RepID=UPI00068C1E2E|nr:hypothetical protein [Methylocapsa aurea]
MTTASFLPLACLFTALAGPAFADEPRSPAPVPVSMQAYGDQHLGCLEWTDSCRICRRLDPASQSEAEIACSTPGIACQPGEIACKAAR